MKARATIGDRFEGIVIPPGGYTLYQTGQKHRCPPDCAAAGHRYKHKIEKRTIFRFTKKVSFVALPDGRVSIPGVGYFDDVREGDL